MKTLVLGDIHGRTCWNEIIDKESPDHIVFLGDYVSTHHNISEDVQIKNCFDILDFKENNSDKVTLLRGNHDIQHLKYYWAECCGYFRNVADALYKERDRFLNDTQWIKIDGNIIYSHAGVSQVWLDNSNLSLNDINNQEPTALFGFTPDSYSDYSGDSITQPPTWIRPLTLIQCNIEGYTQIVGHTPVHHIVDVYENVKNHDHIWLCDCLPNSYLIIENDEFIVKTQNQQEYDV